MKSPTAGRSMLVHGANAVLICGTIVGLAAFAYYCFRYAPSADDSLLTPFDATARYVVVALLPIVLFLSLFLKPARKVASAGLLVGVVGALYVAEVFLDVTGMGSTSAPLWSMASASPHTKKTFVQLGRAAGVEVDARDRIEVLDDMRAHGVDAVPAVMLADILIAEDGVPASSESRSAAELLPLGGISRSTTVLCNESGQYVTYKSDQHGLRNPASVWNSPRLDVAALGQSLTQGYCVPDGAGFIDLLRPRYPATVNLGVSGESALLQLAAIKEYLPPYAPRAVFWFFYEGQDLHTLYEESTHPLVMRYLEPTFTQHLATRQDEIDAALRQFVSEKEAKFRQAKSHTTALSLTDRTFAIMKLWHLRENVQQALGITSDDATTWFKLEELAQNLLGDALVQANTLTRSWGGTLYFVYLPSWERYHNGASVPERDRKRVLNLVSTLGIPIVDIHTAFAAAPDPLALFPFRRFGHYNEEGNRVVADALQRTLTARDRSQPPVPPYHATPSPEK